MADKMAANPGCAALSGGGWARRGLLLTLAVFLLISLVYSAPVPENEDPLAANNDLASGEATDVKTNLDDGFDDLVGVQSVDEAKPKETEVIYRTQTQGITLPHFKFTTGPTTLPPIPKMTTLHPVPMQTTPRPDQEELHIDIQGVMTKPAGPGPFTTAHVPEPVVEIETTQPTEPTTTTVPETTAAEDAAAVVVDVDVDKVEPIDELLPTTTTTTETPPTTTTTTPEETTVADGGAVLVGGAEVEDLEPIDKLLETDSTTTTTTTTEAPTTTTTTTTEAPTEAAEAVVPAVEAEVVDEVGGEAIEEETTAKPSTTPKGVLVIVDGGDEEEPSSSTTTTTTTKTTTTTTTTEPITEAAEKPVYPAIVDVKDKTIVNNEYTTPTTTVLDYTTKLPTEEPSSTTAAIAEVIPIAANVDLAETKAEKNKTDDEEFEKIVVSINAEPTVLIDPEDEDLNGTMIGESTQGGLSSGARTGIAIACIVGFWIILGPLVCLICKMRDKKRDKKEQEERNAREKASNHLVEEMVKNELQKQPNGDHKKNGDYKKAQYKDETPVDEAEIEPIKIIRTDSVPFIDDDADSRDTEL